MKSNVTLKEIAFKSGVSVSTVHRVLNNKEGVGEELREKILTLSKEMGYSLNFAASTLKRKTTNFSVILPDNNKDNKYYVQYLLEGYKECKEEIEKFNIEFDEYQLGISENEQLETLKRIFYDTSRKIDGLLIAPVKSTKIVNMLNRFTDKGIPVVLVEKDLPEMDRLTCVKPNNVVAGRIAGELLCNYIHIPGKVIIADGDVTVKDPNELDYTYSTECENMIRQINTSLEVEKVHETSENDQLYHKMLNILANEKNIVGICAATARNTIQVSRAMVKLGLKNQIKIIGSEIFTESTDMLNRGVIDTIIYRNPHQIGYDSLKHLFDHVIKGENVLKEYSITPEIILKSNLLINDGF